jgi:hypothetical protein
VTDVQPNEQKWGKAHDGGKFGSDRRPPGDRDTRAIAESICKYVDRLKNSENRAPCKKSPIPLSNDRFKIAEAHLGLSEEISGAATECVELKGRDSSRLAVKQIANSLHRAVRGHQLGAGNWKVDRLHERNITIQELCEDPRIRAKKHGVIDVEANSGHGRAEAIFRGANKGARIENA